MSLKGNTIVSIFSDLQKQPLILNLVDNKQNSLEKEIKLSIKLQRTKN